MNIYDLFDPNTVRRLYRIKGASLRFIGQCVVIFTDTELLLTRVQFILAICSIMLGDKEQAGAKADGNCRWDLCRLSTINVLRVSASAMMNHLISLSKDPRISSSTRILDAVQPLSTAQTSAGNNSRGITRHGCFVGPTCQGRLSELY